MVRQIGQKPSATRVICSCYDDGQVQLRRGCRHVTTRVFYLINDVKGSQDANVQRVVAAEFGYYFLWKLERSKKELH